jgi:peptide/nickel transport system ATP-binding protein
MATLLITHDLGIVAEMASRVFVMYAGRIVEGGPSVEVLRRPRHPYTVGLLGARPRIGTPDASIPRRKLAEIPGTVPLIRNPHSNCAFSDRCARADAHCRAAAPPLESDALSQRSIACWHPQGALS